MPRRMAQPTGRGTDKQAQRGLSARCELPAASCDISAAAITLVRGEASIANRLSKGGFARGRGAAEGIMDSVPRISDDRVVGDEADARPETGPRLERDRELAELHGVLFVVVDARERCYGPHGGETGDPRVLDAGVYHVVERMRAVDRHEKSAHAGSGATDGEPEAHLRCFTRKPRDSSRESRRAHGDLARVNRECARLGQDGEGLEYAVEIGERLPHALKHHAVYPLSSRRVESPPDDADLLDDFPCLKVPLEPHPSGRAERAAEGTSSLRADAHGESARLLEGDPYGLDDRPVGSPEGQLHEPVDLARQLAYHLERRHAAGATDEIERHAPYALARHVEREVAMYRADYLARFPERDARQRANECARG